MDINKSDITNRILELFNSTGMQAKEFTAKVDIYTNSITEWKKGRAFPSTDAVIKIADYFNVSTDYILKGTDPDLISTNVSDPEWREIYNQVCSLSEKNRIKVTSYIQGYLKGISENEK